MSIVYAVCVPHPPLIIPEVGKGEQKGIQTTIDSYEAVMKKAASFQPELVIITSPHDIFRTVSTGLQCLLMIQNRTRQEMTDKVDRIFGNII